MFVLNFHVFLLNIISAPCIITLALLPLLSFSHSIYVPLAQTYYMLYGNLLPAWVWGNVIAHVGDTSCSRADGVFRQRGCAT